jgi:anti-sigma B factor antagonist
VALLTVAGEHDLYTAPALREQLDRALAAGDLIVDLSDATFVDSSVLGALLNARQRAIEEQRGFAVCLKPDSSAMVRQVFEITGLMPTMPVLASVDEAGEALMNGAPRGDEEQGK